MVKRCNADTTSVLHVPSHALHLIGLLEEAGFETWIVGGWVRDALLGHRSSDIDMATQASPLDMQRIFSAAGHTLNCQGAVHGTIGVLTAEGVVEITTFRQETTYSDIRHPDAVQFVDSIYDDLARRDFTMNALAYHPVRGLLDCYEGLAHLSDHLLVAVGDPHIRLQEDALRIMRAVRFAGAHHLDLEASLETAVHAHVKLLKQVSSERLGVEFLKIAQSPETLVWMLQDFPDVVMELIPELRVLEGCDQKSPYHCFDVWDHTRAVVKALEAHASEVLAPELMLAALLHDVAKPDCMSLDISGRGHFFGHAEIGAQRAEEVLSRFALPKQLIERVVLLIKLHDMRLTCDRAGAVRLVRALRAEGVRDVRLHARMLLALMQADARGKRDTCHAWAEELRILDEYMTDKDTEGFICDLDELAINGHDVMEYLGLPGSPAIRMMLEYACEGVLESRVVNRKAALLEYLPYPRKK